MLVPFSRFRKMPAEKRERLLTIAAQEFAIHGFEAASLNRILEEAQIGKSSAYYYFEDKADLFCTVVEYCFERLEFAPSSQELEALTAETFWQAYMTRHQRSLLRAQQEPWWFGAVRAVDRLSPEMLRTDSFAPLADFITNYLMTNLNAMMARGQALGLIRTDVPNELLIGWFRAIDSASDDWLLSHLNTLDQDTIERISRQTMQTIQRALAASATF